MGRPITTPAAAAIAAATGSSSQIEMWMPIAWDCTPTAPNTMLWLANWVEANQPAT